MEGGGDTLQMVFPPGVLVQGVHGGDGHEEQKAPQKQARDQPAGNAPLQFPPEAALFVGAIAVTVIHTFFAPALRQTLPYFDYNALDQMSQRACRCHFYCITQKTARNDRKRSFRAVLAVHGKELFTAFSRSEPRW